MGSFVSRAEGLAFALAALVTALNVVRIPYSLRFRWSTPLSKFLALYFGRRRGSSTVGAGLVGSRPNLRVADSDRKREIKKKTRDLDTEKVGRRRG